MKNKNLFTNETYIVDSISSAFAVAILGAGKKIKCIYESKNIDWRKTNYETLFDLLLSDMQFMEKEIVHVPHPYFIAKSNLLSSILNQWKFILQVREIKLLKRSQCYFSCSTSSILIANKSRVKSVLIDEGMGSLIARNRPGSVQRFSLKDFLKRIVGESVFPFRFKSSTPQVTLSNDPHKSVFLRLDYRKFESHAFKNAMAPLIKQTEQSKVNVLVLLKGPSHNGNEHVKEGNWEHDIYTDFNINVIQEFVKVSNLSKEARFYLKTHPSLGKCPEIIERMVVIMKELGLIAYGVDSLIDFEESSSLPAEGLLRYGNMKYLLAADVSSSLWNVAHWQEVKCYAPLEAIIEFSKVEKSPHENLYRLQYKINELTGNNVIFF